MPPKRRKSSPGGKAVGVPLLTELRDGQPTAIFSQGGISSAVKHEKSGFKDALKKAFLPEDYLSFQAWDTAQALCSYIRGLLTSQAVLKGVGVGQQAATPLAAVFTFFVRDMSGMFGGILFALWQGSSFDTCAKQWRIFADVTNDIGMAVELASPFFPGAFMAMACFGSIARAVTGVAGGATRAALTLHFARTGNAADIAAKESSQETATTLAGMVLGMGFTHVTADHAASAWLLFVTLTILHIWANVRALRCLVLQSLNLPRLSVLVDEYMLRKQVPSPVQLAVSEDLTPPPVRALLTTLNPWAEHPPRVVLGAPMTQLAAAARLGPQQVVAAVQGAQASQRRYILALSADASQCLVVLHAGAGARDVLQAHVHARQLSHAVVGLGGRRAVGVIVAVQDVADTWMRVHYPRFLAQCGEAGWDVNQFVERCGAYRVQYDVAAETEHEGGQQVKKGR